MIIKIISAFIVGCIAGGTLGVFVMAIMNAASIDDMDWERLRDIKERKEECIEQQPN